MGLRDKSRAFLLSLLLTWVELVIKFLHIAIAVWAVVTIVLGVGLLYLDSDSEIEAAISPYPRTAYSAKKHFDDEFPDVGKYNLVYLMTRDDNILTLAAYTEILEFDTRFKAEVETDDLYFKDLCYHLVATSPCLELNHPLSYWQKSAGVYDLSGVSSDEELLSQIHSGRGILGNRVNSRFMFGDADPDPYFNADFTTNITASPGVVFYVALTGDDDFDDEVDDYEAEMEDFFDDFNDDSRYIKAYGITYNGVPRGAAVMISQNVGFMMIAGLPIMLVCFLLIYARRQCRLVMLEQALGTVVTIASAFFQGIGLAAWTGVPDSLSGAAVAPFMLFVVSLPHSFFILTAFSRTSGSPMERVQATYKATGIPLLASSLIHVLAWSFLCIWNIVRLGNVSANLALVYSFLILDWLVLTPVLLYYTAWRQSKNIGDFGCCPVPFPPQKPKVQDEDKEPDDEEPEETQVPEAKKKQESSCSKLRRAFGLVTVQGIVGVMLAAFLAVNIYYASIFKYKISSKWLVIDDSSVYDGLQTRSDYFEPFGYGAPICCRNLELSKTSQQVELVELAAAVQICDDCDENWFVEGSLSSWYTFFQAWVSTGACSVEGSVITLNADLVVDEEYFVPCLKQFLASTGLPFNQNIQWNDDETEVTATFISTNVEFFDDEDVIDAIHDVRDVVDAGPGDCTTYNPIFIFYDHYLTFARTTALHFMLIFGAIAVMSLASQMQLWGALMTTFLSSCTAVSMLAVIQYAKAADIEPNAIAENLIVLAFASSADFYLYYLAFLDAQAEGPDRPNLAMKAFLWPAFGKLLVIVGAACGLATAPKFSEYTVIALLYGFVNFLQSVFALPLLMMVKLRSKVVEEVEVEVSAPNTKRTEENELEMSIRLKDDTTIVNS
jgi:hypothetical protein